MRRILVCFVLVLLCFSFVLAQDGWEEINVGGDEEVLAQEPSGGSAVNDVVVNDEVYGGEVSGVEEEGDGEFYKPEFYIAIGIVLIILVVLFVFIWFWLRGPRNRWD